MGGGAGEREREREQQQQKMKLRWGDGRVASLKMFPFAPPPPRCPNT